MRAVVQRVTSARVTVGDRVTGEIGHGLLVFVGVEKEDTNTDVEYVAAKIREMRIFEDEGDDTGPSTLRPFDELRVAPSGVEGREPQGRPEPRRGTTELRAGRKRMNRSVVDVAGSVLVVSQFTLAGDLRRGRRPSFDDAAPPEIARALYEEVVRELRAAGITVATGEFQAMMRVRLDNDGPVTILVDSRRRF